MIPALQVPKFEIQMKVEITIIEPLSNPRSMHDLVVKNGTVIDPSQGIHGKMDVAITNREIVAIAKGLGAEPRVDARQVIDASGRIVTPGLIDMHVHVYPFWGQFGCNGEADQMCLASGVTTAVDCGSAGSATLRVALRGYLREVYNTRLFLFLNISSLGLSGRPELSDLCFADVEGTIDLCKSHPEIILGVKVRLTRGALGKTKPLEALRLAREAAEKAGKPLMVHGIRTDQKDVLRGVTLTDVLSELRSGDILTHPYAENSGILDEKGKVIPEVNEAVERGVMLDVAHGRGNFSFEVASKALDQGLRPDTISTDLTPSSIMGPVYDLPTTISKFLTLGMSLDEAIEKTTAGPARIIGREGILGTIKTGASGDLTILDLQKGTFEFTDAEDRHKIGRERLVPIITIREGRVFLSRSWSQAGWVWPPPYLETSKR